MVERSIKNKAKKARTRALLIESAKKLFYEKGYEKVKIEDIIKTAGVSVGTFYEYFQNKDEILLEIAREANQSLIQRISYFKEHWTKEPVPLEDRIREGLDTAFDFFDSYPYCVPVIAAGANSRIPVINEVYDLLMQHVIRELAEYLRVGKEMGGVKDLDPEVVVTAIIGILSGVATSYSQGKISRKLLADTLTELIADGILPDSKDECKR